MASHSSAFTIAPHPRNVPDDVLGMVRANNGVVMVNFYPPFVNRDAAEQAMGKFDVARRLMAELDDDDAVVARVPVSIGPESYPFTLIVRDENDPQRAAGNWTRSSVTGLLPSNLPEISDLAVAADSGGTWTRDGVTFLAVSPLHVTKPDGELHLYFEVYGLRGGTQYEVEIRAIAAADAEEIWAVQAGVLTYRASFSSEMPGSSGISPHHLRVDLSDTPDGAYALGVRVTDLDSGVQSLPVTTPVVRAR